MSKKRIVILIVAALLVTAALAACGAGSSPPTAAPQVTSGPAVATAAPDSLKATGGATLLDSRCSSCHAVRRVTQERMTRDEWDQTVTRMIGRGAKLSEAEKAALVDYLAATYGP